ncbi:MAG: Uma2 family endonuclease [Gemmataceae bacterium]
MATSPASSVPSNADYPTSAGRPRVETEFHRALVDEVRRALDRHFTDPFICVAAGLLVFYVPGDRRRHVTPDLFVARGVARRDRPNYLIWEEGKGPDFVLEVTTLASRTEDTEEKFRLYRDVLLVPEYFLFDPQGDALDPPLQGYRLHNAGYLKIEPVDGALPSNVLGLHLRADGPKLRLYDPTARRWLPTLEELTAAESAEVQRRELAALWTQAAERQADVSRALGRATAAQVAAVKAQSEASTRLAEADRAQAEASARQAEAALAQEEAQRGQADVERLREQIARLAAEAEVETLRREVDYLRRHVASESGVS